MDQIIQNFITTLKSKQLKDHRRIDIEVFIDELPVLYRYCYDNEQCKILEMMYKKMVEYINGERGFTQYSIGYLDRVKKQKNGI